MEEKRRHFPSIACCDPSGRAEHAVAADLDGTLLVSRSSFPYFMLLAVEAGGVLWGVLLLLLSPVVLFLYRLVSEAAGIQLLIFVSVAGLRVRDIERAARAVLARFYAADVRANSWRAFRACRQRRVVVMANPTVMVEPFVEGWLGGARVQGTDLQVELRTGRATGLVAALGVLVGCRKREAFVEGWLGGARVLGMELQVEPRTGRATWLVDLGSVLPLQWQQQASQAGKLTAARQRSWAASSSFPRWCSGGLEGDKDCGLSSCSRWM